MRETCASMSPAARSADVPFKAAAATVRASTTRPPRPLLIPPAEDGRTTRLAEPVSQSINQSISQSVSQLVS